ncbi:hypothetical protein FA13DRAFT_1140085 [Coprinellus micaceus]|uniref:Uncharacterized protein n=1 Tax=Coprinellus micaceus TaxID=71717 RepID=A0A4Y7SV60_COPMI|nr:hypothetical protein FA13DRAFT_1140085 [Coprinellus micaceus]
MPATRSQTSAKRRSQPTASGSTPSTQSRGRARATPRGGKHRALPSSAFDPPALPRTRTPPLRVVRSPPPRRWATPLTESSRSSSRSRSPSRSGSRSRSCSRERRGGSSTPRAWTPIRWRSATPVLPSFPLQTSLPEARFYAARYGTPTGYTRYRRPRPQLEPRDGREHDGASELDDTEVERLMNEWIDVDGDIEQGGLTGASKVSANSTPSSSRVPSPQCFENKSTHGERDSIHAHSILAHDTTQGPMSTSIAPPPAIMAPVPLPPAVPHPLIQGLMSRLSPETQAAMLSPDPDVDRSVQFTERDMVIGGGDGRRHRRGRTAA